MSSRTSLPPATSADRASEVYLAGFQRTGSTALYSLLASQEETRGVVAESQPCSEAERAGARRFDQPRATVLGLLLG